MGGVAKVLSPITGGGKAATPVAPATPIEPKKDDTAAQAAAQAGGAGRAANTFTGGSEDDVLGGGADSFSVRKRLLGA